MRTYSIPFVIAMALTSALLSTACDDDGKGPTQPTFVSGVVSNPEFGVAIRPTPLVRRTVAGSSCPLRHPFFSPLELVIDNPSRSTVFLDSVRFQFIDSSSTAGPQTTMHQSTLIRRFGHVGLPAQSSRIFPFSIEFGCGTLPTGRINIFVQTIDGRRARNERSLTVFVR